MNALVKKEIRSILPGWIAILLLESMIPWFSDQPDIVFAVLPYFFFGGMVILAIDSFGREFSSGTFSLLLSQPIERKQIWRTKIIVLFIAVASIFIIYFASCWLRTHLAVKNTSTWHRGNANTLRAIFEYSMFLMQQINGYTMFQSFIATLIAVTGALWTTLLLRQIATAFWIAFLTPAALAMTMIFFIPEKFADAFELLFYIVAILYSGFGFWLARKLFYNAQDVGWTGGVIAFSRWRYFESGSESFSAARWRRPMRALFRKEFQLHSIALVGAGILLGMHVAVFFLRALYTNFHKNSTAAALSDFFWVLWLVMPLVIGCMAVAEERKLAVMDEQFCLPVSRRLQFLIKFIPAMFFGILIGGVMPLLLEGIAAHLGDGNEIFTSSTHPNGNYVSDGLLGFKVGVVALSAGFALAAFFGSTLAKNFLQALSITIVTIVGCVIFVNLVIWVGYAHPFFFGIPLWHSVLPILIALLIVPASLIWLSYLNFNHFQESKRLWRRNVIGISGALLFIIVGSAMIYNRAWEIFEPAEPPHGAVKLSLQNPPEMHMSAGGLTVLLPDGRAWLNYIGINSSGRFIDIMRTMLSPLPHINGPAQFIHGSNWTQVTTDFGRTIGIQSDGTLWISRFAWPEWPTPSNLRLELTKVGDESDWLALESSGYYSSPVYLLKTNHTLWEWDAMLHQIKSNKLSLPRQIGTNSDWAEISFENNLLRKTDGTVWTWGWTNHKMVFERATNLDDVEFKTLSHAENSGEMACIDKDGTLKLLGYRNSKLQEIPVSLETNWVAASVQSHVMTALKSDGTLWKWQFRYVRGDVIIYADDLTKIRPTQLGIHNDCVAITDSQFGIISLAADGSVWLWFNPQEFYRETLLKNPKQPQFLGNVFGKAN